MVTRTRITSTMFLSLSNELVQITFMSTIHSSMIWVEQYSLPECIYIGVWIKMAQFVMNNPWIIIVGLSFLISRVSVWEDWTMMAQFVTKRTILGFNLLLVFLFQLQEFQPCMVNCITHCLSRGRIGLLWLDL